MGKAAERGLNLNQQAARMLRKVSQKLVGRLFGDLPCDVALSAAAKNGFGGLGLDQLDRKDRFVSWRQLSRIQNLLAVFFGQPKQSPQSKTFDQIGFGALNCRRIGGLREGRRKGCSRK